MSRDASNDDETQSRGLPNASREVREQMSWILMGLISVSVLSPIILRFFEVQYAANPGVIMAIGSILIALLMSERVTGRL